MHTVSYYQHTTPAGKPARHLTLVRTTRNTGKRALVSAYRHEHLFCFLPVLCAYVAPTCKEALTYLHTNGAVDFVHTVAK